MQTSLSQGATIPLVICTSKIANSLYINCIQQYLQFYLFIASKHHAHLNTPKKEVAQFSEALVST
jgi:Ni,Fe-hydrogenase I cytochrome b subunit